MRVISSYHIYAFKIIIITVDEPPHQILLYTLLFSLLHYFLYITDPQLHTHTPANTTTCDTTVLAHA